MSQLKEITVVKESSIAEDYYEYYLAISSDSLAVFHNKTEFEKFIIEGKDNNAYLCACTDINHFLDIIDIVSDMINNNINPINYLI